jgi:hypothetical protein
MNEFEAEIEQLKAELAITKNELEIIQTLKEFTYCAYCAASFRNGPGVLAKIADHILVCEKHPLQAMAVELEKVWADLASERTAHNRAMFHCINCGHCPVCGGKHEEGEK